MSNFPASLAKLVRQCDVHKHYWLPNAPNMPCPFCAGKTPRVTKANFATVNQRPTAVINTYWIIGGDASRRNA